jgi:hypothetical protein
MATPSAAAKTTAMSANLIANCVNHPRSWPGDGGSPSDDASAGGGAEGASTAPRNNFSQSAGREGRRSKARSTTGAVGAARGGRAEVDPIGRAVGVARAAHCGHVGPVNQTPGSWFVQK